MGYRKVVFANNQYYHLLNRSVGKIPIFETKPEINRFLELVNFYRFHRPPLCYSHFKRLPVEEKEDFWKILVKKPKIIEINAFCLMPNHFHFVAKQLGENGIPTFMSNLQNSYAKYYNIKNDRSGSLFQEMFKAVRIEDDNQLLHVARYIHLNPCTAYLVEIDSLANYPYSSYPCYVDDSSHYPDFLNPKPILDFFKGRKSYENYVRDQADYQRHLEALKHLVLEKTP